MSFTHSRCRNKVFKQSFNLSTAVKDVKQRDNLAFRSRHRYKSENKIINVHLNGKELGHKIGQHELEIENVSFDYFF